MRIASPFAFGWSVLIITTWFSSRFCTAFRVKYVKHEITNDSEDGSVLLWEADILAPAKLTITEHLFFGVAHASLALIISCPTERFVASESFVSCSCLDLFHLFDIDLLLSHAKSKSAI